MSTSTVTRTENEPAFRLTNRWTNSSFLLHAHCKETFVQRQTAVIPDSFDDFSGGLRLSRYPVDDEHGKCIECGEEL